MKDFFKFMLASMLGFVLVLVVIFFISLGLFMGLMSFAEKQEVLISENTVLRIDLKDPIPERTPKTDFLTAFASGSFKTVLGLNDILGNIHDAKNDDNIKGIVLNMNIVPSGISTLEEVRNALLDFKESGKFVLCYGEYMTQSAYYIGSVADEIYLHPEGFIDFKGLNARVMFLKGMLDKLDINMQIVRHGKFKSAIEPLIQKKMSAENREQYSVFINSIWDVLLEQIGNSRGLSNEELNSMADGLIAFDADMALEAGLVDDITDRPEYRNILKDKMGLDDITDVKVISLSQYARSLKIFSGSKEQIAVIFATGAIGNTMGGNEEVGADKFAETIAKVRRDENVKAVVFRVNSPGGDALASDIIWKELDLLKARKPVIVSMGDVAASGGYWISSASDKILANRTTLTGSIGVFGVIPDFGSFMENKLGITFDRVGTNEYADFPPIIEPLDDFEREVMQRKVDKVYDLFLERVSNNRGLSTEEVDLIGEGRVWSGVDALEIGLIDAHGGLSTAIDLAAEIVGIEDYRLLELPVLKDPIEQLIEDLSSGVYTARLKSDLGPFYTDYRYIQSILEWQGVQARMIHQPVLN